MVIKELKRSRYESKKNELFKKFAGMNLEERTAQIENFLDQYAYLFVLTVLSRKMIKYFGRIEIINESDYNSVIETALTVVLDYIENQVMKDYKDLVSLLNRDLVNLGISTPKNDRKIVTNGHTIILRQEYNFDTKTLVYNAINGIVTRSGTPSGIKFVSDHDKKLEYSVSDKSSVG